MNSIELKQRTKNFALAVIKLVNEIPKTSINNVFARQILRSSTSIGANYRAACRSKSKADFIYKIKLVEEESDETLYWLELLFESDSIKKEKLRNLLDEANQLTAIFSAISKTSKRYKNS